MARCSDGLPNCNRGKLPPEKKPGRFQKHMELGLHGVVIHPFLFGNGGWGQNTKLNHPAAWRKPPHKACKLEAFENFEHKNGAHWLYANEAGDLRISYVLLCWSYKEYEAICL
jgi:hypothetical protein